MRHRGLSPFVSPVLQRKLTLVSRRILNPSKVPGPPVSCPRVTIPGAAEGRRRGEGGKGGTGRDGEREDLPSELLREDLKWD